MHKVLLVEDDVMVQMVTAGLLESLGCEVISVGTAKEAIAKGKKNNFDIIFLDLGLPDLSGIDVSLRLRREGVRTPIIALTGRTPQEEAQNCFDARMDGFLQKPSDSAMLKSILAKHLNEAA